MKPSTKLFLVIATYSVALWATNWRISTSYAREIGVTQSGLDLRGIGALAGGLITVVCLRRLWKLSRELLDRGVRIPASMRIWGNWRMLWFLLPLAIVTTNRSSSIADDGSLTTTIVEYGGDLSFVSIVVSASAIMLFQTVVNLESLHPDNEQNKGVARERATTPVLRPQLHSPAT